MKLWIDYEVAPPSNEWFWEQSLGCAMAEIINMVEEDGPKALESISMYDNPSDILGLLYYFSSHNIECPVLIHGKENCE